MLGIYVIYFVSEVLLYVLCGLQPEIIVTNNCIREIVDTNFVYPSTVTIFTTNATKIDIRELKIHEFDNIDIKLKDFGSFNIDFGEINKQNSIIVSENLEELMFYKKQISKLSLWNARANYIFYTTKNNSQAIINKFINILWDNYIINAIIITQNKGIFTYFPYGDIVIKKINTCQNDRLQKNVDLFPLKVPNDLKGYPVNIRVIIWPPYIIQEEEIKNYNNVNFKSGIEIELTKTIAERANFSIVYSTSKILQDWGLISPNGTANGSMTALMTKEADLTIGSYAPSAERYMYLDYSICHLQDALTCCVPKAQLLPKWRSLVDTFHPTTWLLMIFTYIIVSLVIWLLCSCPPQDTTSYVSLNNSFNFVFSIFLSVSAKESPQKKSGRIVFFLWIIFSLHYVIAYQAKLISVLTHPSYEKQMDSVEEMLDSDITLVMLWTIRRFFANSDDWRVKKILKNWKSCYDSDKCLSRIAYERDSAFFTTKIHMEFETLKYVDSNGRLLIYCFENSYMTYPSLIFMSRGFPLRERIDTLIARVRDSGLIFKWQADIARIWRLRFLKSSDSSDSDDNRPLTLLHLQGAFFVSGIGWLVSLIVFFAEIFITRVCKS